jgi:hypothetical protein
VAGDDVYVDATDPANPEVGVVPHTFLRLNGTEAGFPVTGDLEVLKAVFRLFNGDLTASFGGLFLEEGIARLESQGGGTYARMYVDVGKNAIVESDFPTFKGIQCQSDEQYYELSSLIKLETFKSRLWNGTTDPAVTDDSAQGFVANRSLWLNTTTGVLWRCTDATAGAAVWTNQFSQFRTDAYVNLGGGTIPAGATQYAPIGSQAAFNADETTRFTPQPCDAVVFKFKVRIRTAQPATGSLVVSLRANSGNISTITIPAGSAAGTYTSNTVVAISEDDLLTIGATNNASTASAQLVSSTLSMYN